MNEEYMLHTIGGGDTLWTTFNAIASLMRPEGGSLLPTMIFMGTIIGVVSSFAYTVFKNEIAHVSKWYISSQVILLGLLTPVSTLHIHDHMTGFNKSVDNVPFALAFMASHLSSIGSEITHKIEAVFQPSPHYQGGDPQLAPTDDHMRYSKTGFMFASHVMMQMKGVQLTNEDMMDNLKEFVNQCVVYDALLGHKYTIHDLKHSDDLWALVSKNASKMRGFPFRAVERHENGQFIGSTGTEIMTCKEGVSRFNAMWNFGSQSLVLQFVKKLRGHLGLSNHQPNALNDGVYTYLPGAMNKLSKTSRGASNRLQQQVMISAILQGNERKTIELGGSPNLDVRRAYLQQQTTYQTIGQTIAQTLPSLKTTIECLAYALFIFVVFLSLLPRGSTILLFYMKLLLWLQLWPPLFSILNFIMTESMASSMVGALKTAEGVTIGNMVGLANMASDMSATAGYLCAMIPVLSWALIEKGGYAFVSMASGILGVSQNAASAAAVEKMTGNYSAGNISMDGYQLDHKSAFKHDFAPSYADGFIAMNTGVMSSTHGADGETIIHRNESQLPVSISAHQSRDQLLNEAINQADSFHHANSEASMISKRQAYNDYFELGKQASSLRESGVTFGNEETSQVMRDAADHYDKLKQIGDIYGISEAMTNSVAMEAHVGGGTPINPIINIGGGVSTSEASESAVQKGMEEIHQFSKNSNINESMSAAQQSSKNKTFHTSSQETNQLVDHMSSALEQSKSYEQTANKARETSHSLQQERAQNQSQGTRVDANLTQEFVNTLGADKVKHMSTPELYKEANTFSAQHTNAYQRKLESQLNHAGIKANLDTHYKNKHLVFTTDDLTKQHQMQKNDLSSKPYARGLDQDISDAEAIRAVTVIARNNLRLDQKQNDLKEDVNTKGENMKEKVFDHTLKEMGITQKLASANLYHKYKKNEQD